MAGTLKVGTITTPSGSGTITIPSGVTLSGGGLANTPAFSARLSSNQSLGDSAWVKGNFDTEIFDSDGKYDTANARFTPTVAGYYRVSAHGYLQANDGNFGNVAIYKNGSEYAFTANGYPFSNYQTQQISVVMYLDTDDYVEAYFRQISGLTRTLLGENAIESNFSAYKIIGA